MTMPRPPFEVEGFVGQRAVLTPIIREQDGAIARDEPMPHTLALGPSGIGKTELVGALARRAKVKLTKIVGKSSREKICESLLALKRNDYIVFDEGHNQDPANQEMLYEVIDTGMIPARWLPGGKTPDPAPVAPCTIVFSTDQPGKLLNALLTRLPQRVRLHDYTEGEMREIVSRIAEQCNVLLSPQAARQIARVSNGLPRRAKNFVRSLRRYFPTSEQSQIGIPQVDEYLQAKGITSDGLTDTEIDYIRFLHSEQKASLETLAANLGVDAEYVRTQIEQPLFYRKFVQLGGGGRSLTTAGLARAATLPAITTDADEEPTAEATPVAPTHAEEVTHG